MIAKFLLLGLCAVTLVKGDVYDSLKKLTDEGLARVQEVAGKVQDPSEEYKEMTSNRRECLLAEHDLQMTSMNESIGTAVGKGMLRNNKFSNFECISNVARDTFGKISSSKNNVLNMTQVILNNGAEKVRTLRLIMPGLTRYVREYYETKKEEMKKAKDDAARQRILEEVTKKMEHLKTVLKDVENKVTEYKFKFFEGYVAFVFETETNLKKLVRESAQKALKCVV